MIFTPSNEEVKLAQRWDVEQVCPEGCKFPAGVLGMLGSAEPLGAGDSSLRWRVDLNDLNCPLKHHTPELLGQGTMPRASDPLLTCWGEKTQMRK